MAKRDLITAAAGRRGRAPRGRQRAGGVGELAGCVVVIEAIAEDLAAKRDLLADLEAVVADDALLALQHLLAVVDGARRPGWHTPSVWSACTSSTRRTG